MRVLAILALLTFLLSGCASDADPDAATETPRASDAGQQQSTPAALAPIRLQGQYIASAGCSQVGLTAVPDGMVSGLAAVPPEAAGHAYTSAGGNAVVNGPKCIVWLDAAGTALGVGQMNAGTVPAGAAQVFVTGAADVGLGAMSWSIDVEQ